MKPTIRLIQGDCFEKIKELESQSVDCIFTSPDPPMSTMIGIGSSDHLFGYASKLTQIFHQASRVLKDKGVIFIQTGDYHDNSGSLRGIPFMVGAMLMADGWLLRSDLIWHRPDDSPHEDPKRFKRDCEHIFMLAKTADNYFECHGCDTSLISVPYVEPRQGEFLSGFPNGVIRHCLSNGCPEGGTVLDPFCGSGKTGIVALQEHMNFIGIELEEWKIPKILKALKSQG